MSHTDPLTLLFGGMDKLAPGDDTLTLLMLRSVPRQDFQVVVDAGCGSGRQTLALVRSLRTRVHAVDSRQAFLDDLTRRADREGLGDLVQPHCMNMQDIPRRFPRIDLLWSEGAAYSIGFANALTTWAGSIPVGGFAVVSELCWLDKPAPPAVSEFFQSGYPDMKTVPAIHRLVETAGYRTLITHTLPATAWVEGYYDLLGPRAHTLLSHEDPAAREAASDIVKEIQIFEQAEGSYGYVFFALERV